MIEEHREVSDVDPGNSELDIAHKTAWSIENRERHENTGNDLHIIGKHIIRGMVFTYYKDDKGRYWYKSTTSDWQKKTRKEGK